MRHDIGQRVAIKHGQNGRARFVADPAQAENSDQDL